MCKCLELRESSPFYNAHIWYWNPRHLFGYQLYRRCSILCVCSCERMKRTASSLITKRRKHRRKQQKRRRRRRRSWRSVPQKRSQDSWWRPEPSIVASNDPVCSNRHFCNILSYSLYAVAKNNPSCKVETMSTSMLLSWTKKKVSEAQEVE